jgi:hypothetical protein
MVDYLGPGRLVGPPVARFCAMLIRITQIGITQSCATVCVNPIQPARMRASRRRIESGSCQAVGRPSHTGSEPPSSDPLLASAGPIISQRHLFELMDKG